MSGFMLYWLISFIYCGVMMIFGIIVDRWSGIGTTAKDIIIGIFTSLIPGISTIFGVILMFYVITKVLDKADTIKVVKGKTDGN